MQPENEAIAVRDRDVQDLASTAFAQLGESVPSNDFPEAKKRKIRELRDQGKTVSEIAVELDIDRGTARKYQDYAGPENVDEQGATFRETRDGATWEDTSDEPIKTLEDAIRVAKIDLKVWYVDRWECSQWSVQMNIKKEKKSVPVRKQQYRVKVFLKRKTPALMSMETLLDEMKASKLKLPVYKREKPSKTSRRALEVSIMDVHLAMRCYQPQSDHTWSFEEAEQAFMATTERLLLLAKPYGPFETIVAPIGNDMLHTDNVFHTTTAGTGQPECDSIHEGFIRAKRLYLWFVERLRKVAPVEIFGIPGNHDRILSFTLAQLVQAFYDGAKAKDVRVDASPSPYKFWRFGVSLTGFDHGHSVNPSALAALMANETRLNHWKEARYCEWHLGDQHRKASGKPSTFESQGCSVEYLPGLTPPNEWSRLKGFNWQKRGAMAFVYDFDAGPLCRLQTNFDNYSGKIMGVA